MVNELWGSAYSSTSKDLFHSCFYRPASCFLPLTSLYPKRQASRTAFLLQTIFLAPCQLYSTFPVHAVEDF